MYFNEAKRLCHMGTMLWESLHLRFYMCWYHVSNSHMEFNVSIMFNFVYMYLWNVYMLLGWTYHSWTASICTSVYPEFVYIEHFQMLCGFCHLDVLSIVALGKSYASCTNWYLNLMIMCVSSKCSKCWVLYFEKKGQFFF